MTVGNETELAALKVVGKAVADTLRFMGGVLEPGMTTKELDDLGRKKLDSFGARSAPELTYGFPGATCISVNNAIAHGIPCDDIVIAAGDMVNIDVSAEKDGFFADTGASYIVPPVGDAQRDVCRATKRALARAIDSVKAGKPLNGIGKAIESVARRSGHSIIENLQSHGVGASLHEEPKYIPSYYDPSDRRRIHEGQVFTIEPFLSTGATMAEDGDDDWTLVTPPGFFTAQYEHSLVATRRGAIILTL